MTTNQQKTIDELKVYYNTINSIGHTNDIINAIEEVLNGKRIKKAKEDASKLAARSMAIEGV